MSLSLQRAAAAAVVVVLAAFALVAPVPAKAQDHDALHGKLPGDLVGVKIEQKSGHWLYKFRAIDSKGRMFEIYVDAHTAAIERIREK
jgi:uncharacterized membrane protein YkoI